MELPCQIISSFTIKQAFLSPYPINGVRPKLFCTYVQYIYFNIVFSQGDGACTVNSYGIESTHNATKNKKKRLAGTFIERTRSTDRVTELLSMLPYPEQDITAPRYWCQVPRTLRS